MKDNVFTSKYGKFLQRIKEGISFNKEEKVLSSKYIEYDMVSNRLMHAAIDSTNRLIEGCRQYIQYS